jgi:hypothetical protein
MDFGDVGAVDAALDALNVSLDHLIKPGPGAATAGRCTKDR